MNLHRHRRLENGPGRFHLVRYAPNNGVKI